MNPGKDKTEREPGGDKTVREARAGREPGEEIKMQKKPQQAEKQADRLKC